MVIPLRDCGGMWDFVIKMKVGRSNEKDKKILKCWSHCTAPPLRTVCTLSAGGTEQQKLSPCS